MARAAESEAGREKSPELDGSRRQRRRWEDGSQAAQTEEDRRGSWSWNGCRGRPRRCWTRESAVAESRPWLRIHVGSLWLGRRRESARRQLEDDAGPYFGLENRGWREREGIGEREMGIGSSPWDAAEREKGRGKGGGSSGAGELGEDDASRELDVAEVAAERPPLGREESGRTLSAGRWLWISLAMPSASVFSSSCHALSPYHADLACCAPPTDEPKKLGRKWKVLPLGWEVAVESDPRKTTAAEDSAVGEQNWKGPVMRRRGVGCLGGRDGDVGWALPGTSAG